jgi:hypothetical protein
LPISKPGKEILVNNLEERASSIPSWVVIAGFILGIFLMLIDRRSANTGLIYGSVTACFLFLSMTANVLADKMGEFKNALIITSVLITGFLFIGYVITVMFLVASLTNAIDSQRFTFWMGGLLGLASSLLMISSAVRKMKKGM